MDPQTLMLLQQYMSGQGQGPSTTDPLLGAGQGVLGALAQYLSGAGDRRHTSYLRGEQRGLIDLIKQGMNQPAVSRQHTSMMRGNARRSLAPTRANMLWRVGQTGGGMGSEQTNNMFLRNYLPVEAQQSVGIDQWAQGMNQQKKQGDLALLAGLTRG